MPAVSCSEVLSNQATTCMESPTPLSCLTKALDDTLDVIGYSDKDPPSFFYKPVISCWDPTKPSGNIVAIKYSIDWWKIACLVLAVACAYLVFAHK